MCTPCTHTCIRTPFYETLSTVLCVGVCVCVCACACVCIHVDMYVSVLQIPSPPPPLPPLSQSSQGLVNLVFSVLQHASVHYSTHPSKTALEVQIQLCQLLGKIVHET